MTDSLQCSRRQYPFCWRPISSNNMHTIAPPAANSTSSPNDTGLVIGGTIALVLPFLFVLPVMGYRKYRTIVLHRQMATLERLWKVDSHKL
ncbi:hypothetical protein [Phormidesmis sp. 146-33]